MVRWCRVEEDAARQFCGQEHATRVDVPACPLSPAVLGVKLDSFEVSKRFVVGKLPQSSDDCLGDRLDA